MSNNKGFTLVELLAVIVILAIILVIGIPNIMNIITKAKQDAYERQKELIITVTRNYVINQGNQITWNDDTAEVYLKDLQDAKLIDDPLKDPRGGNINNSKPDGTKVILTKDVSNNITYDIYVPELITDTTPPVITLLGSSTVNINQGDIYTDLGATALDDIDGDITSNIVTNNNVNPLVAGTYTITYNVTDNADNDAIEVTRTVNVILIDYIASKGVNHPRLIAGMTPIKWDGSAWIDTNSSDTDWYNYTTTDKKWANAKTIDGSMWVWIPRYAYQITANYHTSTLGTINIKFLKENTNIASDDTTVVTTPTYSGSNQTNYILHPAFTFGTTEVTGIWVAKFEASGTTNTIGIKPNMTALRATTVGDIFTAVRNMETSNTYGWGTTGNGLDTHMMKNVEWGAAAYLSQSTYGKNAEIWINSANNFTTGCAGNSVSSGSTVGCLNTYNTVNGMQASTTGNIYGIYDMVGGVWEYVAAYVNNGHANLTTYGSSILSADSKYKDVYTVTTDSDVNNYNNAINKKGDALYETSLSYNLYSAWNNDYSIMPFAVNAWICRGGHYNTNIYGGTFAFNTSPGEAAGSLGFRPIILINSGL